MKMTGLLRAFRLVRSQPRAGIRPEDLPAFTGLVKSLVRRVEEICAARGMKPEQLPAPSRRVYTFLKELDTDRLPTCRSDEPVADATPGLALRNVLRLQDHFAERLWRESGTVASPQRDQIREDILRDVAAIEGICSRHGTVPSALQWPASFPDNLLAKPGVMVATIALVNLIHRHERTANNLPQIRHRNRRS